jgi:hypothetical protein
MRTDNTVAIDRHALGTLKYIRSSIESAGVLAVPGMAGIAMGAVGLAATALASLPELAPYWLAIWLCAAVAASALGGVLLARQAVRNGSSAYPRPARKFLVCLCPPIAAGAVLTGVLWQSGLPQIIPGMWLLLYGCAVLSSSTVISASVSRLVAAMGGVFMAFGFIAFQLPPGWHNLILGAAFGGLHFMTGVWIWRRNHGEL